MTPKEILSLDGVLDEAINLIQIEGYTISEAAHAIRKKYNPLENEKKRNMAVALRKALNGKELKVNEEARSTNIYLVGKTAQRVLNTYNKWKGTKHTLVDFVSYTKTSPKQYSVILKDGQHINITGREIRKIRNTRLLSYMNFGVQDIRKVRCPVSGLPLVFTLDAFENRAKVVDTYTYDLHHMDVTQDGKSEIKNGLQPSRIVLETDLFEQENIDSLTEFFGMIMLSPSGHKGIHSEYSNEVHKIDDYKINKRPWAIRSEKNYLKFFKEFGLTPKYSFDELKNLLGFSVPKKKKAKKLTPEQREKRRKVKEIVSHFNSEKNYSHPLEEVYSRMVETLEKNGLGDEKILKIVSFGKARTKKAKEFGWN